jgi:hypothetical protein
MEWRAEVWECADGLGVRQTEVNRAEGRRVIRRASNARVRSWWEREKAAAHSCFPETVARCGRRRKSL